MSDAAPTTQAPAAPEAAAAATTPAGRAQKPRAEPPAALAPDRLLSLDVFRGITIAAMLLVNNPGSWAHIHPPLRHAEWHGWTPTDLIFPFFLFIVGVAMTLSFARLEERGTPRRQILAKAARRAAILFGLGLVLHGFPAYDLASIRIPGVLQRIALAYFAATAIVLATGLGNRRAHAAAAAALLLGYWALLTLVPVPGSGAGVLEPGRDLGAWLDRAIFGENHLWAASRTWDPEGLLSTIPAVGTVLIGILAGHAIRRPGFSRAERTAGLFFTANILLVLGLAWDAVFPINKPLWTSSYVLFTGGMALHFLAACYWLVDVKRRRRWAKPFVIYGTNAIAAYFLASLFARILNLVRVPAGTGADPVALKTWIYQNLFAPWASPVNASLAYAVAYVLLWLAAMGLLYRRRIFIKV